MGNCLSNVVLVFDDTKLVSIAPIDQHDSSSILHHKGLLMPGFVNTHCHLELSHLKGRVDTGTGLLPFLEKVVTLRDVDQAQIDQAIVDGDREMYEGGIVAVGDICNKIDTASTKSNSPIRYYSFVEMFDFLQPAMTQKSFDQYYEVFVGQSDDGHNKKSMVPHAPYTVSPDLFAIINAANTGDRVVSIHNQETAHENAFFIDKSGGFADWYKQFGFGLEDFKVLGKSSIHYAMQHLDAKKPTLFVHNTMTTPADISAAQAWNHKVYWATCPNANLYIENMLPDYKAFIDAGAKVTIGTDSLTSNWQLNIWEEIKAIRRYASFVPLELLVQWATANGAEALGWESDLGSLTVGKTPGLVHVACKVQDGIATLEGSKSQLIVNT